MKQRHRISPLSARVLPTCGARRIGLALALLTLCAGPASAQLAIPPGDSGIARVSDFFDLSGIGEAPPSSDPGSQRAATSGGSTLDVLHGDVVEYTDKLCHQVGAASRDEVDALLAEYDGLRREQEAELDRIAREELALEELQRQIDEGSASAASGTGVSSDAAANRLADARRETGRLETLRKERIAASEVLRRRHGSFGAASGSARTAGAEIARIEEEIRARRADEIAPDKDSVGGLGAGVVQRNLIADLERDLEAQRAAFSAALTAMADALPTHPVPTTLDGFNDPTTGGLKGTLYREWQSYRADLSALDSQVAEARAVETAAFADLAKVQSQSSASQTSESDQARIEDYRSRGEQLVVARTVALLSFQLHGNVTDCIRKRAAKLEVDEKPKEDGRSYQVVRGTIHDTCYGRTDGPDVRVTEAFEFKPGFWRTFALAITDDRDVKLFGMVYLSYHDDRVPDPPGVGRASLQTDGSFELRATRPVPDNIFYAPPGAPLDGTRGLERTPYPPFVVKGRLAPDPTAPQGWRGQGTGSNRYRRVEENSYMYIHQGEPCAITWTIP